MATLGLGAEHSEDRRSDDRFAVDLADIEWEHHLGRGLVRHGPSLPDVGDTPAAVGIASDA